MRIRFLTRFRNAKLRKLWQGSIKQRILFTFVVLILLPTLLFLALIIRSYSQDVSTSIISEKKSVIEQINKNISYQLQYYESMTMTIYHNEEARQYIDNEDYSQESSYVRQLLSSIVNSEKDIASAVLLIGEQRYVLGSNFIDVDMLIERYKDRVLSRGGRTLWIPTQNLSTSYNQNMKNFVLARAINSPRRNVGTLWLFFRESFFDDVLENRHLSDSSSVILLSSDHSVITSKDKNQVGYKYEEPFVSQINFGTDGDFVYTNEQNDDRSIIVYSSSMDTGWTIVTITPEDIVFDAVNSIKRIALLIFVLYALFALAAYFILARDVFKPVSQLRHAMLKVSGGDFSQKLADRPDDEIGQLINSYNYMTGRITDLMEDVRQEEKAKNDEKVKVLSMQIGPHFIYNTLNTIKWMAAVNKQPNIKRMIESLIKLMVNVTYNTNEEIPLADEIELIKSYAYIQKARYMNFDISYNIPSECQQLLVLKFIIQPLIENCILYAFSGQTQGGHIEITATIERNNLVIMVCDNGCGFDAEKLQKQWPRSGGKQELAIDEGEIASKDKWNNDNRSNGKCANGKRENDHIGLINVVERIKLNYGAAYGLDIISNPGAGTQVLMRLPLIKIQAPEAKYD
ncbi:MAG: histidine kinase [Eubacteriales bacterium]|nr:histidine kinase [Eubacteriales bacterium]MDD3197992.1 histidine kinase [Eubacteriales bacterium]MDD3503957.1 histidine kinase [Eubacteriales bacterium]MDD4683061.1 histidine kinase [Eubacteriales bacterium]